MASILIIDDEAGIRSALASILEDEKYTVFSAEDAETGLEILTREAIDLVFLDVLLPKLGGMEALERIRRDWLFVEIIIISGHANVDMAVKAIKLGAFDFLEKPLSLDRVLTLARNALAMKNLRDENRKLKSAGYSLKEDIIGSSEQIVEVREKLKQAADSDARVLLTGENGSGKEIAARTLHYLSARSGGPFVEVNCAAIPETLIESELFGHEKGAFTDAHSARRGRFEMAHNGTLFLDEIGDMSLPAQAKVLRVIQEQKFERLGSEKTIEVNVRLVAATNQNLEKACDEGRFRRDLFFRLNVIPIYMPALRERAQDVPMLLFHFLKTLKLELAVEDGAIDALCSYSWPGNVRELKNLAERIAVMHREKTISKEAMRDLLNIKGKSQGEGAQGDGAQGALAGVFDLGYSEARDFFEKSYLEANFAKNGRVISKTAESIGVYPSNLHSKLKKYKILTAGKKEEK
ncbi:MAG: sigma-54 dependent transcriptional regulator [Spirochaetes bacterium]|nr:sigma-54 dependent transcriptional regulator [Spirochaetota bacterium]